MPYNTLFYIFSSFLNPPIVTSPINNADTNICLKDFRHWERILQGLIEQRFSGIKSFYRKGEKGAQRERFVTPHFCHKITVASSIKNRPTAGRLLKTIQITLPIAYHIT